MTGLAVTAAALLTLGAALIALAHRLNRKEN